MGGGRAGYWERVIAAYRASGLSQEEFCRRRSLSVHSLRAWLYQRPLQAARAAARTAAPGRRELAAVDDPAAGRTPALGDGSFVPVCVVADEAAAGALEVLLANGRKVAVRPGFDGATLRQLVTILEQAPC